MMVENHQSGICYNAETGEGLDLGGNPAGALDYFADYLRALIDKALQQGLPSDDVREALAMEITFIPGPPVRIEISERNESGDTSTGTYKSSDW